MIMPDPVNLPRKLFIPGLQKVTVTPQADGSIDVVGNFAAGTVNITGGPLSFNPLALLTLFEDLATDLPKLIADVTAVFGATPPVPAPAPTPTPTSPTH
jgi:hypothetical protein